MQPSLKRALKHLPAEPEPQAVSVNVAATRQGGAPIPEWRLKGPWLKNCNCLASCPCDTIGRPTPADYCEGMVAMNIREGHFDGVNLNGLKWAMLVHFPGAIHEGNGEVQLFVDASRQLHRYRAPEGPGAPSIRQP